MEFYIPTETGEFLAFCAAVVTSLLGLDLSVCAGHCVSGAGDRSARGPARRVCRSALDHGGFHLGLGIAALLLAQPMVYLGARCRLCACGVRTHPVDAVGQWQYGCELVVSDRPDRAFGFTLGLCLWFYLNPASKGLEHGPRQLIPHFCQNLAKPARTMRIRAVRVLRVQISYARRTATCGGNRPPGLYVL